MTKPGSFVAAIPDAWTDQQRNSTQAPKPESNLSDQRRSARHGDSASTMGYKWAPHKELCYQLYIKDRLPLEDVMEHMKNVYQFTPSKRAFQVQFSRWDFPLKQRPAHKDERLVKRIHELWQRNTPQREILRILNEEEGFDINARELIRVRARNRWLLRSRHGDRARSWTEEQESESLGGISPAHQGDSAMSIPNQEGEYPRQPTSVSSTGTAHTSHGLGAPAPKPVRISKRQSRRNRQQAAEGELVRFPSEMTLNDCKNALGLTMATYTEMRECFQRICEQESIVKKTLAGPERWDYVKNRLIHERPHLQEALWVSKDKLETKQLALDIISTDVTKRMRNSDTMMSLFDAKNVLGLDPTMVHDVRASLHEMLCEAKLTNKTDVTPEKWEEMKRRWVETSPHIKDVDWDGEDAESRQRVRAVEIVARDVIKRRRDEKSIMKRKGPQAARNRQPEPREEHAHDVRELRPDIEEQHPQTQRAMSDRGASRASSSDGPPQMDDDELDGDLGNSGFEPRSEASQDSHMSFGPSRRPAPPHHPTAIQPQNSNLPSSGGVLPQPHRLLAPSAATDMPLNPQYGSSLYLGTNSQPAFMDQQYVSQQFSAAPSNPMFQGVQAVSTAFAVFLRLHPSSTYATSTSLWIGTMTSQSVQELRQVAIAKLPGAMCVQIEGILKDGKGTELPLQIQEDEELGAYFAHMQGGPPTFAVQLV
ncbi:hypothetical protein FZEAL_4747 [Fusarium zealandicum]|uniref:Clr5 domain-containing protein n=1 Tax=Fusarium zealandicum TaxID=1053134 RepID=A0A8H4ULS4_9HYPO|nr:hypothetical protein FZEAL_4747 [Fusarium zealandicum]